MNMKKKVLVFSADAMVREDIEYLQTKPNFSMLMEKCAQVTRVKSIYPSITYPAHISILTGCYPDKHGVVTNSEMHMVDDGMTIWLTDSNQIKVEDLFAAAKRGGYTTASVYWPVTGYNKNIDYLINEYFFPDPEEDVLDAFLRFGANAETLDVIQENLPRFTRMETPPGQQLTHENSYEHFINGCACSLIRRYQPDLLLMHNCVLDTTRHNFGTFSNETLRALDLLDEWLGELIEAMKDAGVYDITDFVLLSDHGQMDYNRLVKPNVMLKDAGFIQVDENNNIVDWQAYTISNWSSAYIFLKDKNDRNLHQKVEKFLRQTFIHGGNGIQEVYGEEELCLRYHLTGDFSFMLECEDGVRFSESWNGSALEPYVLGKGGSHGYLPEKGPWPVFLGAGPSFRPGAVIPMGHIIDEAPTIASILGVEMLQADGKCMTELLR